MDCQEVRGGFQDARIGVRQLGHCVEQLLRDEPEARRDVRVFRQDFRRMVHNPLPELVAIGPAVQQLDSSGQHILVPGDSSSVCGGLHGETGGLRHIGPALLCGAFHHPAPDLYELNDGPSVGGLILLVGKIRAVLLPAVFDLHDTFLLSPSGVHRLSLGRFTKIGPHTAWMGCGGAGNVV